MSCTFANPNTSCISNDQSVLCDVDIKLQPYVFTSLLFIHTLISDMAAIDIVKVPMTLAVEGYDEPWDLLLVHCSFDRIEEQSELHESGWRHMQGAGEWSIADGLIGRVLHPDAAGIEDTKQAKAVIKHTIGTPLRVSMLDTFAHDFELAARFLEHCGKTDIVVVHPNDVGYIREAFLVDDDNRIRFQDYPNHFEHSCTYFYHGVNCSLRWIHEAVPHIHVPRPLLLQRLRRGEDIERPALGEHFALGGVN